MKVAAFQAPLAQTASIPEAVARIRDQVERCEVEGIRLLCCPEAVLGGLGDSSSQPGATALHADGGELDEVLAPLATPGVAVIIGFTEMDRQGRLFNAAAVYDGGRVIGLYRKHHPAIRSSVYTPGTEASVFSIDGFAFGVIICRDSIFPQPAARLAAGGAVVLFCPTNNALPRRKGGPALTTEARAADVALATTHGVWVVRADVAGESGGLASNGSSGIVDAAGRVIAAARPLAPDLLIATITSNQASCRTKASQ